MEEKVRKGREAILISSEYMSWVALGQHNSRQEPTNNSTRELIMSIQFNCLPFLQFPQDG